MTATTVPTMLVEDVELRAYPAIFQIDPLDCDHLWEPHLWRPGRAQCCRCGSFARWTNDPRAAEAAAL